MTVKELLQRIDEPSNSLLNLYEDIQIEKFIGIYEMLDKRHQAELAPFVKFCRAYCVGEGEKHQTAEGPIESAVQNKSQQPKGRKPVLKQIKEKNLLEGLSPTALSVAQSTTINQAHERGMQLESARLLAYFHDGEDSLETVLKTSYEFILNLPKFGRVTANALDDWQTIILKNIKAEKSSVESILFSDPTAFLQGHACATLDLRIIVGDNAPYNQVPKGNRLLNSLIKIGCYTIEDLFDYSELRLKGELGKQTFEKCQDLKEDIQNHLDEYDRCAEQFGNQNVVTEYPILSAEQQQLPLIDKIVITIRQLNDLFSETKVDKAHTVEQVLLHNKQYTEAADILRKESNLSGERRRQFVQEFVDKMMSGNNNPLVPNHYVASSLLRQIQEVADNSFYITLTELGQKIGTVDVEPYSQILHYIFGIDQLRYISSTHTPYLGESTGYTVPEDQIGDFRGDIKTIYDIMQHNIEPLTKEEIYESVLNQKPDSEFYRNTDAFNTFIDKYEFFEHIGANPTRYRLYLPKLKDWPTRIAAVIFDHKDTALSLDQIIQLYEQVTKQKYDFKGQVSNSIFQKKEDLAKKIIKKKQGWVYDENTRPVISSWYTFIHDYIVEHETFFIQELKDYLSQNFESTCSETTLMVYVYRYSVQSLDKPGLFCYSEAIERHPEHHWKIRFDSVAVNYSINVLRSLLQSNSSASAFKPVGRLKILLTEAQQQEGYPVYSIENLIRRFSTEDETNAMLPFILQRNDNGRKLGLNKLAESTIDWDTIGLNKRDPFIGVVKARVVQTLRVSPNLTCEREELYAACKPLLEDSGMANTSIIHEILYHNLSDVVEWWSEGNKAFFRLLAIEKEVYEAPVADIPSKEEPTTSTKQILPLDSRPEPNREEFTRELTRVLQSYRAEWPWNMEGSISDFIEFLWKAPSKRIREQLRQYWYEFLVYKVDKYVIQSIYSESLSVYEKFLRLLNEEFTGVVIRGTYGLGGTVGAIDAMNEFNRKDNGRMHRIYETVYHNRNKMDHGEDLPTDINVYVATRDALALYVYTYALMDSRC